jgi:hypothetical protein
MKIKIWLLFTMLIYCIHGFAQASDTLGFDLTFEVDGKAENFEKQYTLTFIGDNSSFYKCEYELTAIDSGVSIRIHGQYEYVVGPVAFTPILVISQAVNAESRTETSNQYFVQFVGFRANGKVSGVDTVTVDIGKLTLAEPDYYIQVYNGRPMVNGNIFIKKDSMLNDREWQYWQRKMPHVTKVTRDRS